MSAQDNNTLLAEIFANLFELDAASITDESSQDTIEKWDSFGMVSLINELEATFNVKIDLLDVAEFKTVGLVKSFLAEQGVQF